MIARCHCCESGTHCERVPEKTATAALAGGDLRLVSMPGYGVDCYLSIPYLEGRWEETRVEPHADATSNVEDAVALP